MEKVEEEEETKAAAAEEEKLLVSWSGQKFTISIEEDDTILDLKLKLMDKTSVLPERQKIMGLVKGRLPADSQLILPLLLSNHSNISSIMMLGTPENAIFKDPLYLENLPDINDDFDPVYDSSEDLVSHAEIEEKLSRFASKLEISLRSPIRKGKKLLVLDLDYTLFDHKSVANDISELVRPGMHDFLEAMYQHYNIAIWSQTSTRRLNTKLTELGILNHSEYKILFILDAKSMFSIVGRRDGVPYKHHVKALELIWRRLDQGFGPHNTIHVDDLNRNFALNPKNGIKISAFREKNHADRELVYLARYLVNIAEVDDVRSVNHSKWRKTV